MASRGNQQKRIYALYRGNVYIRDGTIRELAQQLGIKFSTAQYYATKQHRDRAENHGSPYTIILDPVGWTRKKRKKNKIRKNRRN